MKAELYLIQIRMSERKIENKIAEIQRLETMADNISPHLSEVKVSSTPDPHRAQEVWSRLVDAQDELINEVDALTDLKKEVTRTLEKLPPSEYDVLHRIYVRGQSVQKVADETHYSRPTVYKIKSRGIEMLQKILDSDERV